MLDDGLSDVNSSQVGEGSDQEDHEGSESGDALPDTESEAGGVYDKPRSAMPKRPASIDTSLPNKRHRKMDHPDCMTSPNRMPRASITSQQKAQFLGIRANTFRRLVRAAMPPLFFNMLFLLVADIGIPLRDLWMVEYPVHYHLSKVLYFTLLYLT